MGATEQTKYESRKKMKSREREKFPLQAPEYEYETHGKKKHRSEGRKMQS